MRGRRLVVVHKLAVEVLEAAIARPPAIGFPGQVREAEMHELRRENVGGVLRLDDDQGCGLHAEDSAVWVVEQHGDPASLLHLTLHDAVKAVQAFQKDTKKSSTKGGLFEGKLLSSDEIKAIGDLPSKEALMAQIAGAVNAVATKVAVGINEVPSGLARALKQHAESGDS